MSITILSRADALQVLGNLNITLMGAPSSNDSLAEMIAKKLSKDVFVTDVVKDGHAVLKREAVIAALCEHRVEDIMAEEGCGFDPAESFKKLFRNGIVGYAQYSNAELAIEYADRCLSLINDEADAITVEDDVPEV